MEENDQDPDLTIIREAQTPHHPGETLSWKDLKRNMHVTVHSWNQAANQTDPEKWKGEVLRVIAVSLPFIILEFKESNYTLDLRNVNLVGLTPEFVEAKKVKPVSKKKAETEEEKFQKLHEAIKELKKEQQQNEGHPVPRPLPYPQPSPYTTPVPYIPTSPPPWWPSPDVSPGWTPTTTIANNYPSSIEDLNSIEDLKYPNEALEKEVKQQQQILKLINNTLNSQMM